MKGGARTRSGPPPDPMALRRNRDRGEWLHLPAAGREGDPPAWPLLRPTKRELQLWEQAWRRPQAIAWEANGLVVEVALYVRALRDAEKPKSIVAVRQLVKQMTDTLGLSVPGLRSNRWIIDAPNAAAPIDEAPEPDEAPASARARLKLVSNGG